MAINGEAVESTQTLQTLMGVCRRWHSITINCPQLWTQISSALPFEVARLVVERSHVLPILSLNWVVQRKASPEKDKVWEVVRQTSTRFRSMKFDIYSEVDPSILPLLESTTTALESLTIDSHWTEGEGLGWFALSGGAPLKHLSLGDVSLDFDTPRLSGLVTLRLSESAVPHSLETLVQALSAVTAQLEELTISYCQWTSNYRPSSSIAFPRFAKIDLSEMETSYFTTLVAAIYAPACSHVRAIEPEWDVGDGPAELLDSVIWQPGSAQVSAFLGLNRGSESRALRIAIKVDKWGIEICVQGQGRLIYEFLLHHPSPFGIDLDVSEYKSESELQRGPSDLCIGAAWSARGSYELVWEGSGVCPNLRSIVLDVPRYKKGGARDVAALQSLVHKRWSGADRGEWIGFHIEVVSVPVVGCGSGNKYLIAAASYRSCNPSLGVIPLERLVSNVDALRVAKLHLDQGADKSIHRIQIYRNSVASIHQIPAEVFELILHKATDGKATESVLRLWTLMSVCRHWHNTIVNCPRLWTRLDPDLPVEVTRLIIKRSKGLPVLSLRWPFYTETKDFTRQDSDYESEDLTDQDKVWKIVRQNSTRFRSMKFLIWSKDGLQIRSLLESTNTALESLTIYSYYTRHGGLGPFALSHGPPLKHLSLRDISFNFDTPRLSGLVTLRLTGSAVPRSLETLVQVLSAAAAHLEELTIFDSKWTDDYRPSSSITFPRLTKLDLSEITASYCTTLVAAIYAPACYDIRAIELEDDGYGPAELLDATIWRPGSTQVWSNGGLRSAFRTRVVKERGFGFKDPNPGDWQD
ncbi:hypothetical protein FRC00_005944 [Tulasnella sp. 408]|nr:hypothetical protein FRC00_005944 [Tulasnella sp. 408]